MSKPGPDPKVTNKELIEALEQHSKPVATANDVAETVGLSRTRASERLQRLASSGKVNSGRLGERVRVYWVDQLSF